MILEELIIRNFRQYYGRQAIEFAKDQKHNVTVIHGENGAGKTALLNALTWCLYGTINLPHPEKLLNERTAAEMNEGELADAAVILRFTEQNRSYAVRRQQTFIKVDGLIEPFGETTIYLQYTDENGEFREAKNPQVAIDQILPERMRSYFFFDGERIDNLAKEDNTHEIVDAIRNVMGLEVVERGVRRLDAVRKHLQSEFKRLGDTETRGLIEAREKLEERIKELTIKKEQHERNAKAMDEEIKSIDQHLRSLDEARKLQSERDKLNRELENIKQLYKDITERLREHVSRYGYRAFRDRIAFKAGELIEESRARGDIPSGIKEQFVQDLLEEALCICGRDLPEGSQARRKVEEWLRKAGNIAFEDRVIEAASLARRIPEEKDRFFQDLQRLMRDRENFARQKASVEEQLDEISDKLAGQDVSEIANLEHKRRSLYNDMKREISSEGECQALIGQYQRSLSAIDKEIERLEVKQAQASLAKRRLEACNQALSTLKAVYDVAKAHVRGEIEQRVNDIFRDFLRKDFYVNLTDTYQLVIRKGDESTFVDAAMSQGERQVASLAFIGGLVAIAKERSLRGDGVFKGGVYPVVMDSPFGYLDQQYRRNVARGLPTMANQVVVFVSSSQWSQEVAEEIRPRIGKEYRLKNHSKVPEFTEVEVATNAAN